MFDFKSFKLEQYLGLIGSGLALIPVFKGVYNAITINIPPEIYVLKIIMAISLLLLGTLALSGFAGAYLFETKKRMAGAIMFIGGIIWLFTLFDSAPLPAFFFLAAGSLTLFKKTPGENKEEMAYCKNCKQKVKPTRVSIGILIILLILGIIPGIIYYLVKQPRCPICNASNWRDTAKKKGTN